MAPQPLISPDYFCLSYNEKHWINGKEAVRLIEQVLVPYINKFKKEKDLPNTKKVSLYAGDFKAQSLANVSNVLSKQRIESIMVPKNMANLLQLLDLTANASLKMIENRAFSKHFSFSILKALKEDPTRDNESRLTTFRLEASTCRCHERSGTIFRIFKRQRGDIELMESSRDDGIPDYLDFFSPG